MPITRDATIPPDAAALMSAMSAVCEGHAMAAVEMASANMFASAIHNGARMRQVPDAEFPTYARLMVEQVYGCALENWKRQAQPGDIPVSGH